MNKLDERGEIKRRWLAQFPQLAHIADSSWQAAVDSATEHTIARGACLSRDKALYENFILVLHGNIRVIKTSDNGREILLYRVKAGEVCVFNTVSQLLLGKLVYGVTAFADSELRLMSISSDQFNRSFTQSDAFREFILSMVGKRLHEIMVLLEEIMFRRLDFRLAHLLLDFSDRNNYLHMTHQKLALLLGTTREVISRMLGEFEHQGWIELHRGKIRIVSPHHLRQFRVS
ncbi:MAG: Crp/Fnr family transcriptional regulator [Gammaproteobacteria bacterium]|nr:Crp/Fnr family transcriptional regulator [Gammaproteobacteria bacterium]